MVKYADAPTAEVSAEIDARPADIWPLVCDIGLPARFSDEFQGAEWIDDGPAVGATFRGWNRREPDMEWDVVCTLTGFEPERVFEWTVGDPAHKVARWRLELTPNGESTTLTFHAEMGPGDSGLTPAIQAMPDKEERIVARRLEEWNANMARTVEGIKALAESGRG